MLHVVFADMSNGAVIWHSPKRPERMTAAQDDTRNIKGGILTKALKSWKEFVDFAQDPKQSCSTLIYRGQANARWKVTSTLDRLEQRFPTTPNLAGTIPKEFLHPRVGRKRQFERFKEMARGKLTSHISEAEEDEWWALAQHHGMATPMLDWTYSPFVALYFAFEQEKAPHRAPRNRGVFALAHHLIPAEQDTEGKERKHPKPFAPRWPGNYRLTNQAGLFLKMPKGRDLRTYVKTEFKQDTYGQPRSGGTGNLHPRAVLTEFTIPNTEEERVECLRFLDHMNINRASLFPDLDGAAQYVNHLWEVNWGKAIGFINDTSCRKSAHDGSSSLKRQAERTW
jgi:hypothetical protein